MCLSFHRVFFLGFKRGKGVRRGRRNFQRAYYEAMFVRMHEKLIAWQESYRLCLGIYALTKKFPQEERFGLVNQMRRASYCVPTNIAEGNTKLSRKDKARFFEIGLASLEELHCQCRLSKDLGYITTEEFMNANDQISKVSYVLRKLYEAQK